MFALIPHGSITAVPASTFFHFISACLHPVRWLVRLTETTWVLSALIRAERQCIQSYDTMVILHTKSHDCTPLFGMRLALTCRIKQEVSSIHAMECLREGERGNPSSVRLNSIKAEDAFRDVAIEDNPEDRRDFHYR